MQVIFEDNHLIAVNKKPGELVQGDKTGDVCLIDEVKTWLKNKYNKPGNVYLGLPHRLDRPTSGLLLFAKTEKALIRLNKMFSDNSIGKTYLAVTDGRLQNDEGELSDWLVRNESENKSYVVRSGTPGAKPARLAYRLIGMSDRYFLYSIRLFTGRHHQIRVQLSHMGIHIKGDLKYGAARSNADGSICLHSYSLSFEHPVTHSAMTLTARPDCTDGIWKVFEGQF